jgi:hypothetical protein
MCMCVYNLVVGREALYVLVVGLYELKQVCGYSDLGYICMYDPVVGMN